MISNISASLPMMKLPANTIASYCISWYGILIRRPRSFSNYFITCRWLGSSVIYSIDNKDNMLSYAMCGSIVLELSCLILYIFMLFLL